VVLLLVVVEVLVIVDEDLRDLVEGGGEGVGRYLVVVGRQERLECR
jgi:hypothetical protein